MLWCIRSQTRSIISMPVVCSIFVCGSALAAETVPTSVTPRTEEQKETHAEVQKKQKKLKSKLKKNASPQEIGEAKSELQKARTEANQADSKQTNPISTPVEH